MAKNTKTIDEWCLYFHEFGSALKTKARAHLDCTDCSLNEWDGSDECPYIKEEDYAYT